MRLSKLHLMSTLTPLKFSNLASLFAKIWADKAYSFEALRQ